MKSNNRNLAFIIFVILFLFGIAYSVVWGIKKFKTHIDSFENKEKNEIELSRKRVDESKPDFNLSAPELRVEYSKNEVSADTKYKDKVLIVEGVISSIQKNPIDNNEYIVTIITEAYGRGTGIYGENLVCVFSKEEQNSISSLNKGDLVFIKGLCKGIKFSSIELKFCKLISSKKSSLISNSDKVKWELSLPLATDK